MTVIYVAGPFRANSGWEREQNIRRAENAALAIWRLGAACICPHTNTRFFDGAAPDKVWLDGYLELLSRCDAVFFVEGYQQSSGSIGEMVEAQRLGIPTFTDMRELLKWI